MNDPNVPRLLLHSIDDAAAILSVHRRTVERLIRRGHLRAVRVGGRVAVDDADLREFVSSQKSEPVFGFRNRR